MTKRLLHISFSIGFLITSAVEAQHKDSLPSTLDEEGKPLILKFEPKMDITANRKRTLFKRERLPIDTMQISEKKKQRLLRNLYKDIYEGEFQKTQISNTLFDDDIEH